MTQPLVQRMDRLEILPNALGFYFLGQVGVAVKGPGGIVYVDPYLTDFGGDLGRTDRAFPSPLEPADVTNATAVLVTHSHLDHYDPDTLGPMSKASPSAVFVGPHTCPFSALGVVARVPAVLEPFQVGGATVTAIPSAHTALDLDSTLGRRGYPYLGYVIEWNGITVYHPGDTVVYGPDGSTPGLLETLARWRIDVAFLPINGRDYFRTSRGIVGNTDLREAAELAEALDVGLVVPTHYDMFVGNSADPGHFVSYLYRLNPRRAHRLLRPGELLYFLKEDA